MSFLGKLIKIDTGAIQFVVDSQGDKFLNVTGKGIDLHIPLDKVDEVIEDDWNYQTQQRARRKLENR